MEDLGEFRGLSRGASKPRSQFPKLQAPRRLGGPLNGREVSLGGCGADGARLDGPVVVCRVPKPTTLGPWTRRAHRPQSGTDGAKRTCEVLAPADRGQPRLAVFGVGAWQIRSRTGRRGKGGRRRR